MATAEKKKQQKTNAKGSARTKNRKRSQMRDTWRRLRRNKLAMVGLAIVLILVLAAIFADFVSPYDPAAQDLLNMKAMPSSAHLLGTDEYGRDILSRIIYGGRVSLLVSMLSIVFGLVVGGIIGVSAGYFGGMYDSIIMRVMDVIMAIPGFLLAVCISAALGSGVTNTALAIGIGCVPGYARLLRALVLGIRDQEYIEAAKVAGASNARIMFRQIVPNVLSTVIVDSTLRIGGCILMISSLSFIGLGVQPPTPEWGSMVSSGRSIIRSFWPLATFPGLAIMLTLFGFNLFGDGLRDALDPKMKQ
jgi:peptide/nickel transport system permease protein